jgi:hypothetical protein
MGHNRSAGVAGFALLLVGCLAAPAEAQERIHLHAGLSVVAPSGSIGGHGAVEVPLRQFGRGWLSAIAGGGIVTNGDSPKKSLAGGVAWTTRVNDRVAVFVGALAGVIWHFDFFGNTVPDFGVTPMGGFQMAVTDRIGFVAIASIVVLDRATDKAYAAHLMAGVRIPLGR